MAFLQNNQQNTQQQDDQNQTANNQPQQNQTAPSTGGGQSTATGAPAAPQAASAGQGLQNNNKSSPQGSGRFTNIKQYINANQGAGNALSSSVQKQVNRTIQPTLTQANTQQQTGQQNITQGNQQLAKGNEFNQQMSANDFTPDKAIEFNQNQANAEQFGKLRTGNAIDTAANALQNQNFQEQAGSAVNQAQQRQQQAANEIGRVNLLKETYGGQFKPTYSAGSSRLDNLLLQGTPGSLTNLQNNIQGLNTTAKSYQDAANQQGTDLSKIRTDQTSLAGTLQDTTNKNVGKFKDALGNTIDSFNTNLDTKTQDARKFLDYYNQAKDDSAFKEAYGIDKSAYGGNDDLWNQFGLKEGQQTFNVLNNKDLNLESVAQINAARAKNWQDVASNQNVNQYDALAKLAGVAKPNYELDKASSITDPYKLNTGDAGLEGKIDAAKNDFLKNAFQTNIHGNTGYVEGVNGYSTVNVGDYSSNPDFWNNISTTYGSNIAPQTTLLSQATDVASNPYLNTVLGGPNILGNALGIGDVGSNLISSIGSGLGDLGRSLFGGSSGNDTRKGNWYVKHRTKGDNADSFYQGGAATGNTLKQYLADSGFNNYLTKQGTQAADNYSLQNAENFGYRIPAGENTTMNPANVGMYRPFIQQQALQHLANQSGSEDEVA